MFTKKLIQTNSRSIYTKQSSIARKLRASLTIYYFGSDKKIALRRYPGQAAYLHAGKGAKPNIHQGNSMARFA
jgi:hypothetical protein